MKRTLHSKYFLTLVFATHTFAMQQNILNIPKIAANNLITDSYSTERRDDFQLSLIPPYNQLRYVVQPPVMLNYMTFIPFVGQYNNEYPMKPHLSIIQLRPEMISRLPTQLKNTLEKEFHTNDAGLIEKSTALDITPQIVFYGVSNLEQGNRFNLVLHPWGLTLPGVTKQYGIFYNITIPVGIYALDGIENPAISVNCLTGLNVNLHPGNTQGSIAFSPNNGNFSIKAGRNIASMWSLALSANKTKALVTFHVFVNTEELERRILIAQRESTTLGGFLTNLLLIADTLPEADKRSLENVIDFIRSLRTVNPAPVQPLTLAEQLRMLQKSLTALQRQL